LQRLAAYLQMSGRFREADPFYRDSVYLHRTLVSRFPTVPSYQFHRAEACQTWGAALLYRGRPFEARPLLEEAVEAQRAFLKAVPESRFGRFVLSHDYATLAEALRRLGDDTRSKEALHLAEQARMCH
jgi:hypothetical protein